MFAAIGAFLLPYLLKFWWYILVAVMVIAGLLGLKHIIQENGALNQKAKDTDRAIKGIQKRGQIERELRSAPDAELDKWL